MTISEGCCQLPGGHVEDGETLIQGVIREIKEETGIELDEFEINKPFYEILYYIKNYQGSNKNRMANTLYYFIKTDKEPNFNSLKLTTNEKKNEFHLVYFNINNFKKDVKGYISKEKNNKNKLIAEEILLVFNELVNTLN